MVHALATQGNDARSDTRQHRTTQREAEADFTDFVTAYSGYLLHSAYLLTGDQQLAEDLVQDALSRTYRAWNRLDLSVGASAYTRKIMYHLQVTWWRRRRVSEKLTDHTPVVAAPSQDLALELTMRAALMKLTPPQRAAIVLRYFEDRTVEETAQYLGCSISSVKTRTRRALDRLRKLAPELESILP